MNKDEALEKKAENARELGLDYEPQRTWVGLTPEDTFEIGERLGLSDIAWVDLMQAIEAKLKAKNT
jgi:hypothetical protein